MPPSQLLVYRVGEGWERLCEFLGHEVARDDTIKSITILLVQVPETEFPHENKTGTAGTMPAKIAAYDVFQRGDREARRCVVKIILGALCMGTLALSSLL